MSYLIVFNFLVFFCNFSYGAYEEICAKPLITGRSATYSFSDASFKCPNPRDCWIQFKAPEDLLKLEVDGNSVFDFLNTYNYISNESFIIPISPQGNSKNIIISATDLNQNINFSKNLCLRIGRHGDLRWINSTGWFFQTGANLYSAYFLIIISFFLIFSFWLRKSGLGLSLLIYSLVSIVYLISFSEYPRAIFDPILTTGGLHFPLRLLQDLCLVFVFFNFFQKYDSANVIKKIAWIYGAVIFLYVLLLVIGIKDYVYYSRIIIIMAPLVAAPMAIGTWFAFKLNDSTERKVLIPTSILLLLFQLNDLLVFWKLIDGYFTVRLYIPFIVGMALFMYFRRMHDETTSAQATSVRHQIFKEFLHDIKSPLAVLKIYFGSYKESGERQQVIESALDRIEGMVNQIDNPNKNAIYLKIPLVQSISEIILQTKVEYSDLNITFEPTAEIYTFADKTKIQRIFSNIINNAYESYQQENKKLDIRFAVGDETVRIQFSDKGNGIPKLVYRSLFQEPITTKIKGKGIGLSSAKEYISSIGGNINLISKEGFGTTIEIILNLASSNPELDEAQTDYESSSMEKPESLDFVLIDDDKYIRLSWEYFAKNAQKSIKTFSSIKDFLSYAPRINRECNIFLDLNLNGEKSTQYINQIYDLGFTHIILATGEDISQMPLPKYVENIIGKLPPLQ